MTVANEKEFATNEEYLILSFQKVESQLEGFGKQVRINKMEHWFFHVDAAKTLKYRPLDLSTTIAAYTQAIPDLNQRRYLLPEEGTATSVSLLSPQGNEVLRNSQDDWYLYHFTAAPLQENIRVYPVIPDVQKDGVFLYLGSDRPAASAGESIGYVDGNDYENYFTPDDGLGETVSWNAKGNPSIEYQFYNSDPERRLTPKINIFGAGYSVSPVTDEKVQRNLLDQANEKEEVHQVQWGAIRDTFSFSVPSEWSTVGNSLETHGSTVEEEFKSGD